MIREFLEKHIMTLSAWGTYANGVFLMYSEKLMESGSALDTFWGQGLIVVNGLLLTLSKIWSNKANS